MKGTRHLIRDLMHARATGAAMRLPTCLANCSVADAESLQQEHVQAVLARYGGRVIGTKLSGGDAEALASLGITGPLRGPIFSAFSHASPARLKRDSFLACAIEAEIAFRFGKAIDGRLRPPDREELVQAIEAIVPSIEIADSRLLDFANMPPAAILADVGYAGGWVHGAEVRDWAHLDLATFHVRLYANGREVRRGNAARVMGDPLQAVLHFLADTGNASQRIEAGQVISAGTCTVPYLAEANETIEADFGPLGMVRLSLA